MFLRARECIYCYLVNLTELGLRDNRLTILPAEIGHNQNNYK